jgi:Helitron helicase-like domain at N-terminus
MVRENPHVVQDFFQLRTKAMLDTFFGPQCFKAQWWWMRFELQQRGAFHIHGCARLKGAPEMADLGKMVHEGRMAQQLLQDNNIPLQPDESFSASQTSLDKWVQADEDFPILDENNVQDYGEIDSLKQTIKQGLTAEKNCPHARNAIENASWCSTERCHRTVSRSNDRL